jgi:hypothetical protein
MIIFFLIFTLAVFLQTTLLPVNFAVLLITLGLTLFSGDRWPVLAFASGLIFDLIVAGVLGFTSLIFLVLIFVFWLYSRKWSPEHPLFLLLFAILSDVVTRMAWGWGYIWWQIAMVAILTFVWALILRIVNRPSQIKLDL